MSDVGTLAWARRTGGRLSLRDRLTLTRLASASVLSELPDLLSYRLGLTRHFPEALNLDELKVPDTQAAKAAETLLTELTPPFMVNHSLRTYWFSRLIGLGAGLTFDDEALYVACLSHDLGFYGRYAVATPEAECFTIRSAQSACDILDAAGWDPQRRDRVAEAITLNANGHVPEAQGHEAHLMMRGVLVDATGMHAWRINPDSIKAIFEQLPLLNQRSQLWPLFSAEADRHPHCRGCFAKRYLQFGLMVEMAPWR